jgi:hypothetical protein
MASKSFDMLVFEHGRKRSEIVRGVSQRKVGMTDFRHAPPAKGRFARGHGGDRLDVVGGAGLLAGRFQRGVQALTSRGCEVKVMPHALGTTDGG